MIGTILLASVLQVETDSYNQTLDNANVAFDLALANSISNIETTVLFGTPFLISNVTEFLYLRATDVFALTQGGVTTIVNGFFISASAYSSLSIQNPQAGMSLDLHAIWC